MEAARCFASFPPLVYRDRRRAVAPGPCLSVPAVARLRSMTCAASASQPHPGKGGHWVSARLLICTDIVLAPVWDIITSRQERWSRCHAPGTYWMVHY